MMHPASISPSDPARRSNPSDNRRSTAKLVTSIAIIESLLLVFLLPPSIFAYMYSPDLCWILFLHCAQLVPVVIAWLLLCLRPRNFAFARSFFPAFHIFSAMTELSVAFGILFVDKIHWMQKTKIGDRLKEVTPSFRYGESGILIIHATMQIIICVYLVSRTSAFSEEQKADEKPKCVSCAHSISKRPKAPSESSCYTGLSEQSTKSASRCPSASNLSIISSTSFCCHAPSMMHCDCDEKTTSLAAMAIPSSTPPPAIYTMPAAPSQFSSLSDTYYNSLYKNSEKNRSISSSKSTRLCGGASTQACPPIREESAKPSVYYDIDLQ
ncbi:hypothetical protein QR680_013890 [Steinernema hermaphroditum]|uniref:Uncharacterized protein n=1 Tax=Steinernema hermaphroditum TaxID=289476 RepID=A0AA39I711_9BILA|nr:hypothetical protein QR680_013890 [Steinernema hermaphroditum]